VPVPAPEQPLITREKFRFWNQGTRANVRKVLAWVFRFVVLLWLKENVSGIFPR